MSVVSHSGSSATSSPAGSCNPSPQRTASRRKLVASGSTDEMDANSDDQDFRMRDLDESEESAPSSKANSDSDLPHRGHSGKPKRNAGSSKRSGTTNVRSVQAQAITAPARDAFNHPEEPGVFKFLSLESYICHCASSRPLQPWPPQCKVLNYFALVFLESLHVVYCPTHNKIIPMSEWATHVKTTHLDWHSGTKKSDCSEMAKHVAASHNLSMDQSAEDINLPDEIEEPLSTNTSNLKLNYQCPQCGDWTAKDPESNFPERFIREKHIKDSCPKGKCSIYNTIPLDKPRWISKVKISGKQKKFHCFILPLEWESNDNKEIIDAPNAPLVDDHSLPLSLDGHQKWPVTLGWCAYDQEISANDHAAALRSLIQIPRCNCRHKKSSPHPHFLEKGLHLVHHAIRRYFQAAVTFVHQKHANVLDAITMEWVISIQCYKTNLIPSAAPKRQNFASSLMAKYRITAGLSL